MTFLNCDPAEPVRIALAAADGKNLEVFLPTIGRQLLMLGLIDGIDLHVVPVLPGQGIRLYDNQGGQSVHLERVGADGPAAAVTVRYRPVSPTNTARRNQTTRWLTGESGEVRG